MGEYVRRRRGDAAGIGAYTAATVVCDWVGYGASPFGAWMATANSQVAWLEFMQLARRSPACCPSWCADGVGRGHHGHAPPQRWPSGRGGDRRSQLAVGWGTWRLGPRPCPGAAVNVAAVVTHVLAPTNAGCRTRRRCGQTRTRLFEQHAEWRLRSWGAVSMVWNEIATVIQPAEEAAFTTRATHTRGRVGTSTLCSRTPCLRSAGSRCCLTTSISSSAIPVRCWIRISEASPCAW